MNKGKRNDEYSVKKTSNGVQSKELLKTLQRMILQESGSVSYIFIEERIDNVHSNKLKDLKDVKIKSTLHTILGEEALKEKSPNELIKMFETTKWDLGANYFIVNS